MAKIVLASGSPRRQELLQRIGITDFTVRVPEADESYNPNMTPEEIVCHISRKKSVALTSAEDEIVITADTMVSAVISVWANPKTRRTPWRCSRRCRGATTPSAPA